MPDIIEDMKALGMIPANKVEPPVAEPAKVETTPSTDTNQDKIAQPAAEGEKPKTDAPEGQEPKKEDKPETTPGSDPKVEVPITQPVPEEKPAVDISQLLGEMSNGELKNADDLKRILDEHKSSKALLEDPDYAYYQKLKDWEKSGKPVELFRAVQDMDVQSLSSQEVREAKLKIDNPSWTEDEIKEFIKHEYNQDIEANDAGKVKYGEMRMQQDARRDRAELIELQKTTEVKDNRSEVAATQAAQETSRTNSWKQNLPKFVNEITKITVPIDEKGGVFDWVPTADQKKEVQSEVEKIVMSAPVKFDEEGIKAIKGMVQKELINRNINQITKSIAGLAASKKNDEHIAVIHNPTGAAAPKNSPAPKKGRTEDDMINEIAKREGIRLR